MTHMFKVVLYVRNVHKFIILPVSVGSSAHRDQEINELMSILSQCLHQKVATAMEMFLKL